jgi:hypothetical protein
MICKNVCGRCRGLFNVCTDFSKVWNLLWSLQDGAQIFLQVSDQGLSVSSLRESCVRICVPALLSINEFRLATP